MTGGQERSGLTEERTVVAFEGREYALTPSPGEVILPLHGQLIHHDPRCRHLTDAHTLPRAADPERLIWRRLIDSAPTEDSVGRAAFAREKGLLNGQGRPVTGVCGCVLESVTAAQAEGLRPWPLADALAAFDRDAHEKVLTEAEAEAAGIREAFPLAEWPALPLARYALGQGDSATTKPYCYLVEFGSNALGSIAGGSAMKHLVFRRKDGSWWHDPRYPDVETAWQAVRSGIVEAVAAARDGRLSDIDSIDAVRSGPSLIAKTLSVYAPESTLPVYTGDLVRHFLHRLTGQPAPRLERFALQARLKQVIDADERFAGWPPRLVVRFLYWWADPNRTRQIVKIAAGRDGEVWEQCRAGGYIAVGWDAVGDLREFADRDEYTAAFREAFGSEYNNFQSKVSAKANELWKLLSLRPGDLVVANTGASQVLAVGRVTDEGYTWRPDRADHRHTVSVEWDDSCAGRLAQPEGAWATVTVKDVPAATWRRIKDLRRAETPAAAVRQDEVPAPPLDPLLQRITEGLDRRGQVVLFGPPGTGKTYTALNYAVRGLGEVSGLPGLDPYAEPGSPGYEAALGTLLEAGLLTVVTFHPSYGYEDFIEGFRPVPGAGGTGLALDLVDGVFKRVCTTAAADPARPYLMVVDELNRGDLPKILGELITLIERDKRGRTVTLPLSGKPFAVPPNVRLIGTMNTADRSIRMLDAAVRRRFAFLELLPDSTPLEGCYVDQLHLAEMLDALNERIRTRLDREKQIGHAYFLPGGAPVDSAAELAAIVRGEVLPLLQEYAYDDYTLLASFLGEELVDRDSHTLREVEDETLIAALYKEFQVKDQAE
ncbi:5-methylcytosine-specific restriction protein B [Streptomyces sp. PsTaAH-137]|nr:AAA domain-containing protein [Streptomyces sp. SID8367]RAJ74843.1 5-methylcytosine-specific restriction protein B [Streptomyces sp. PsTaAH-137]